ncbi:hypothetical protein SASPL_120625 [Salvia splendens]|uniref:Uncharacterized protein n=1 Tax=Salvia splendens TaxID=180675 RepID=A0A8X8ZVT3_SALSN|nr:uncharacterized protein LOC121742689 [Salvia splendens]XP_041991845.1 uncharacterized protein LOC121742689 [Salvia splendens]XP_041991847.1 uncharacterized protein LOC121742689 [Salvia splendens]KAG6418421.1 hypothetical protein SASPL_120625 [Salvia splendens]
MEAQKTGLSLKQKKSDKQRFKKRSPLQNLNALHFPKSNTKITSNQSSAAAAPRNGCLRILLSSNSSSDASLPSSSLDRKPRSLPKVGSNFHLKSFRSKENEFPRKPISDKPKRKQQFFVGRGNGKSKTNPISKTAQMSKISCGRGNSVKKGAEELEGKKLRSYREIGLSEQPLMSLNPVGSSGVRRNAAEESGSSTANGGNGSATSVKTPPVEISVSPEIQSNMMVLKSAATPVCYGTGHLLSGVTDKRKCQRRGSLRGGCDKVNLFNEVNDENVVGDLQDPLMIPLPSEASVRWLLSPCNEGGEDQGSDSKNKLEECEISCGNYSLSPSTLCGNVCELGCDDGEFRGSGSIDDVANRTKAGIFKLSRQQNSDRDNKICDALFAATPNSISNGNNVSLGEGNSSVVSLGCLSSGNLIQTPNSMCSSYECIRGSNVEANQTSVVQFELDSITESLDAVSFSSRCETFPYAGFDSSSRSAVPVQLEKNVCSSESSSTLENLRLNQIKISWRDGIECSIDERDEFDCFPCVSDEEIGGSYQQLKPYKMCHSSKEKDLWMDNDVSPIRLEYEPCICAARKDKATKDRIDSCAESICTNGGDLAVSCDSDWENIQDTRVK